MPNGKYTVKIVSLAICDECGAEITEFCDNHDPVICEPCHATLERECLDSHGTAVRDNTQCNRVDIVIAGRAK